GLASKLVVGEIDVEAGVGLAVGDARVELLHLPQSLLIPPLPGSVILVEPPQFARRSLGKPAACCQKRLAVQGAAEERRPDTRACQDAEQPVTPVVALWGLEAGRIEALVLRRCGWKHHLCTFG